MSGVLKELDVLQQYCTIMQPDQSEHPILPRAIHSVIRQWLMEIQSVDELKKVDVKPRKTAIFSGPPGCGKTTLAHHIAARLGVPLVLVDISTLISMYMGQTGNNIYRLFSAASENSDRMVLMLDEIDAIAAKRTAANTAGGKEQNAIVTHLLQHVDRYDGILIAATNMGKDIDPALWRRFNISLEIPIPDEQARFSIIKRYLLPMELDDAAIQTLTDLMDGATPALLRQMMEGIKRDLVLAPKFDHQKDAQAVIRRVITGLIPHSDTQKPPLWENNYDGHWKTISNMPWPPTLKQREGKHEQD